MSGIQRDASGIKNRNDTGEDTGGFKEIRTSGNEHQEKLRL